MFASFFVACKKEINTDQPFKETENLISRESTIIADNVLEWLSSQEDSTDSARNEIINSLNSNMLFSNMYVEEFREEENFIIVPLDPTYFSKYLDTSAALPLQYLLLVEDSTGVIRRGDIIFFYPEGSQITELPQNSFSDFFNHQKLSVDGTFTLINLSDIKQYEMDFENELPTEHRLWEPRAPNTIPEEGSFCIDWYLITTIYWSDGSSDVYETYLGQTCGHTVGGGGGSYTPNYNGTTISKIIAFIVTELNSNGRYFKFHPHYTVQGTKYLNQSLNTFANIAPISSTAMVLGNYNFNATNYSWITSFSVGDNDYSISANLKTASAQFIGLVTYPNQPNLGTEVYSKGHTWSASMEFQ